jgi:hypothetical protein
MHVPAHLPLPVGLERQLGFLDNLQSGLGLLALTIAQLEQLVPVIDLGKLFLRLFSMMSFFRIVAWARAYASRL